jgi:hypothetical protein
MGQGVSVFEAPRVNAVGWVCLASSTDQLSRPIMVPMGEVARNAMRVLPILDGDEDDPRMEGALNFWGFKNW